MILLPYSLNIFLSDGLFTALSCRHSWCNRGYKSLLDSQFKEVCGEPIRSGFTKRIISEYNVKAHIICGGNSIEHGINLLEENFGNNVLVLSGWNAARQNVLMWELEPRGFNITTRQIIGILDAKTVDDMVGFMNTEKFHLVISIGGAKVIDAAKLFLHKIRDMKRDDGLSPKLIVIPSLSCYGSELSMISSVSRNGLNAQPLPESKYFRQYVTVSHPYMILVQASVIREAPMRLLHMRILSAVAFTVDALLTDSGYMAETLAWDALIKFMPLLDTAVKVKIILFSLEVIVIYPLK